MNNFLYLAAFKAHSGKVTNYCPSLAQGRFLHYASLSFVPEDYRCDLELLHEHFPSLGIVMPQVLSQMSPRQVGKFFALLEAVSPWMMTFFMQNPTPEQLQQYCNDLHHFIETECAGCPAVRELKLEELAIFCQAYLILRREDCPSFAIRETRLPPLCTPEAFYIATAFNALLITHVVHSIFQAYIPMCRAKMSFRQFIETSRGYRHGMMQFGSIVPWTYLGDFEDFDPPMDDDLQPTGERVLLKDFCKPTQSIPDGISCSVCMADVDKNNKDEEQPVVTKCDHYFHQVCLDRWVNDSAMNAANACPSCRAEMCQARPRIPVSDLEGMAEESANGETIESLDEEASQVEGNTDRENGFFSRLRNRFRVELVPTLK